MGSMKTIFLSVGFIWLFYLATVFFLKYQLRQGGSGLAKELHDKGVTLSYCSFNKFVKLPHESAFRPGSFRFSQFLVFPAFVLYFLVLPLMIYTVVTFFSPSLPKIFTFSFPEGSVLVVLTAFMVSALVHELGHFCVALLNGGDIEGIGMGLTLGFPHFYVEVDNSPLLETQRRNIALGGASFNIILCVVSICASWLLHCCVSRGISTPLGRLTELNGVDITSVSDFNRTLSTMKAQFYKEQFIVDNQNLFNAPLHRNVVAPEFGAIRLPAHVQDDSERKDDEMLFLVSQQLIEGKIITIIKPIVPFKRTMQLIVAAKENPQFCNGPDDNGICVLPSTKSGEIGFFARLRVDGDLETVQTSFTELESMKKLNGGNGITQMSIISSINQWLYILAASSLGIAAVSLLAFPESSDGAHVLDTFEAKMRMKMGSFSVLVTGAVRGLTFVIFCTMMIGLCVIGVFGL